MTRPTTPLTSGPGGQSQWQSSSHKVPAYEKSIHEKLIEIYNTVLSLKNNRNKYINSKQIYQIYDGFLLWLHELKITRKDEELKGLNLNLPNNNDFLIDDIWQLLSLCFVTCGLIKFAPATYSSLSTVNKLLDHLKEGQVYTYEDLKPIRIRLDEIKSIIEQKNDDDDYDEDNNNGDYQEDPSKSHHDEENLLLRTKLNKCELLYNSLESNFKNFPRDLELIYNKLISIRKVILNYLTANSTESNNKSIHKKDPKIINKVNQLKSDLKEIESLRDINDGKFHSKLVEPSKQLQSDNKIQPVINGLIDDCNNLLQDLLIQNESTSLSIELSKLNIKDDLEVDDLITNEDKEKLDNLSNVNSKFESIYNQLSDLKLKLENLLVTRRWTMRETDLYSYQQLIKSIDEQRLLLNNQITANQADDSSPSIIQDKLNIINNHLRKNHTLILYLLRRCYGLIYKLLESSEPVSESLQPIHNQLSTVRKCLLEIKRVDGLNNLRELYPFQFKLASLDNLRNDGKFIINNQIPEGQATLNALLEECFDIIHELKIELEEKEELRHERKQRHHRKNTNDDEQDNENENDNDNSRVHSHSILSNLNSSSVNQSVTDLTDDEDIKSDDEVELKRKRYVGFNEADYDQESESAYGDEDEDFDDDDYNLSDDEYEGNDYY
ncbi:uncharacterized protein RJT21DRAFT_121218 [Scheffersomyces amazonensis]|uniref:uncharacterized protein n=1 Tax=Scheffersomyces amazonensis TaxID=1078765 RepID=UPI00315C5311